MYGSYSPSDISDLRGDLWEWAIASHGKVTCPFMEVANVETGT